MCSAVNEVDASGLESLEAINHRLSDAGIALHLSEVKGPVMDRLKRTDFLKELSGRVYLSQNRAFLELSQDKRHPPLPDDIASGLILAKIRNEKRDAHEPSKNRQIYDPEIGRA